MMQRTNMQARRPICPALLVMQLSATPMNFEYPAVVLTVSMAKREAAILTCSSVNGTVRSSEDSFKLEKLNAQGQKLNLAAARPIVDEVSLGRREGIRQ
jgi:hypothetical protein